MLELFPELAERTKQLASSLSGGQQQMLALARVLMHEPEILLIDELSLGLAPVVVQRMLELVDTLKARGQTMLIVEQSLNVALAIADRAIFLEKGEVRFEGPAQELLERDDLARGRVLRDRGRLMLASFFSRTSGPRTCSFIGLRAGPDRVAGRDGHRARLPLEPRHQLRGRRPRRARGRAPRGHGRQARLAVLARARVRVARSARSPARVVEMAVIRRLCEGAARDRARRDDRRRRARAGGHARDPRLPHRQAADVVPEPDDVEVEDLELRRSAVPRCTTSRSPDRSSSRSSSCRSSRSGCGGCSGTRVFGEAVRASATNPDLARLTGISPKLVSTAIWTIAGFLSDGLGDPLRDAADVVRARRGRTGDPAPRADGRADRAA